MKFLNRKQRFSIRKFNVGVASVLLGTALVGFSPSAFADEVDSNKSLIVLEEGSPAAERDTLTTIIDKDIVTGTAVLEVQSVGEVIAEEPVSEISVETKVVEPVLTEYDTEAVEIISEFASVKEDSVLEVLSIALEASATEENSVVTTPTKVQEVSDVEKLIEVVVDGKEIFISAKVDELAEVEGINGFSGMTLTNEALYTQYAYSVNTRSSNLIGDDYPWKHHNPNVWEADIWGAYKRQCTSFVAYRLSSVNNFEIPYAYGNAGAWGGRARREGYRVDMIPAKGAVAWFGPSAFGGAPNYGHVAWVANVYGDKVELEEYNMNGTQTYYTRIINHNEVSGYIHFKDLPASLTATLTPKVPVTDIPNSGRYTFASRVGVKSEAKISSPDLAYYNAGSYVNYDRKLEADGYQWISYVNYSGGRSYIPIAKLAIQTPPATPKNSATTLPSSGRYTFTSRSGVKSEAKISSPDLAYYNAGNSVNYDSVLQADGYQWISYTNYSGGRSYIPVAKLDTQTAPVAATPAVTKPTIPSRGTYTFTKRTSVQAEAKVSSPELAYYTVGSSVRYDRVLVADGHQWISYIATSGNRRYARID